MASGQCAKTWSSSKVFAGNDDSSIMVERIYNFVALVVRALELAAGRQESRKQVEALRNWRQVTPAEAVYVPAPAKAYVKRSGR
jgi:hypothetical protein